MASLDLDHLTIPAGCGRWSEFSTLCGLHHDGHVSKLQTDNQAELRPAHHVYPNALHHPDCQLSLLELLWKM